MSPRSDPRPAQIAVLSGLLLYGITLLDFGVSWGRAAAVVATALFAQGLCTVVFGAPRFDPRSALISGLSLSLLLRTAEPFPALCAAAIAILSKFAIRRRGKHVFNPTCLAIVVLLAASDGAWVSAGQWGSAALFALAAAGLGMLVVRRAERSDVTWAFLAFHVALRLARAWWLGDPWAIPLHEIRNGAFLIFAFFMISDPRTLPDSRAGRIAFAALVALGGFAVQYGLYRSNGLLWSLACAAPLVPLLDRLLPAARYEWALAPVREPFLTRKENLMKRWTRRLAVPTAFALFLLMQGDARAFCGFYVAKADTGLFNEASQVVLVRDGDRTVVTMSNDFQGDPKEFAMVIPVPTFVERDQIHVGDRAVIQHLDAYTAPRLVEYYDADPCAGPYPRAGLSAALEMKASRGSADAARVEGVTIEAAYTVGEYDILILSAEQSNGLVRWLRSSGYRLPSGAEPVLQSYIRQDMRFFVARVNLEEKSRLGFSYLRPLQVAYESPRFMLPIRLGTLNARGTQELFIYTLTRHGRVETTNYRTVKLPTGAEIPTFVKGEFGKFYAALFDEQVRREKMRAVFTEYAWDMNWCDPCAADPLSPEELRSLGVFWVDSRSRGQARDVFVTRLHVRYDAERFPADLVFQETGDRSNFQGRYVVRHPFDGEVSCARAASYREEVRRRSEREARTLASLTGWSLADIRQRLGGDWTTRPDDDAPWWRTIWQD